MVRQSAPDPAEVESILWSGYDPAALGFDVGANCGQSIPHMMQVCARVVAFEPSPESYEVMRQVWESDSRVTLSTLAVSHECGSIALAQLPGEQLDTGQLVTPGTRGMEWDPGDWSAVQTGSFQCADLDSLLAEFGVPEFVKVDTEGHEQYVLAGATQLITRHQPDWLIEFHSPEGMEACVRALASYDIQIVRHPHYPAGSHMWHQHGWIKATDRKET